MTVQCCIIQRRGTVTWEMVIVPPEDTVASVYQNRATHALFSGQLNNTTSVLQVQKGRNKEAENEGD